MCSTLLPDTGRDAGEVLSVRQMIDRMRPDRGVDPRRFCVFGISACAAMTLALLSACPEVFSAGASPESSLPLARSGSLGATATASRGLRRHASR
ncbi:MAG: hypothetical protein LJE70_09630 [Chromatiaceae bacterium]|nr:hypothetical protein [Chromatiaceae bacterium]